MKSRIPSFNYTYVLVIIDKFGDEEVWPETRIAYVLLYRYFFKLMNYSVITDVLFFRRSPYLLT